MQPGLPVLLAKAQTHATNTRNALTPAVLATNARIPTTKSVTVQMMTETKTIFRRPNLSVGKIRKSAMKSWIEPEGRRVSSYHSQKGEDTPAIECTYT